MVKAEVKSENKFCFTIDTNIFSECVITKALYWYADSFIIYWDKVSDSIYRNNS